MNKLLISFLILLCSCEKTDFFNWNLIDTPKVNDLELKSNSLQNFILQAGIKSVGNDKSSKVGFILSKTNVIPNFSLNDTIIYCESSENIFEKEIKWTQNNPIYCRAFIINKIDTAFSNVIKVVWQGNSSNLPNVRTLLPEDESFFSAKCGVELIDNGGLQISRVGFLVSINPQPTINNSIFINQSTTLTNYSLNVDNLQSSGNYYVRGFAENIAGLVYSNQIYNFQTKKYYQIGEQGPGGGIIFYNKMDTIGGWNFLECAPNDLSITLPWANTVLPIQNLSTSIGSGKQNTQLIISELGSGGGDYAAKACEIYSFNGKNDWFLPSRDELLKMYQNLLSNGAVSFQNNKYWSSSSDLTYTQNSWCQKMQLNTTSSNSFTELKTNKLIVRPIRCF